MDTTIALFFSLGIIMSPSNEPTTPVYISTPNSIIAQQKIATPSQRAIKRHELIKNRIAATNTWLAKQRIERRNLAAQYQPVQLASKQNTRSCDANWNLT